MQYNLFISHSWTYSDQYQRLINLLSSKYIFSSIFHVEIAPCCLLIHVSPTILLRLSPMELVS